MSKAPRELSISKVTGVKHYSDVHGPLSDREKWEHWIERAAYDELERINADHVRAFREKLDLLIACREKCHALQKERDELIKAIQIANEYFIKIIKGRYDCPHDNMAECALDEIKELEKMDHAKK